MLTNKRNRIDPSLVSEKHLGRLAETLSKPGQVGLINSDGSHIELPDSLVAHFASIVRILSERRAVILVPEDEDFTTQAAADYLGVSRQHLVDLLENQKLPFHKVGTHRRVRFKDLLNFERLRDETRRKALDKLAATVDAAGHYDSISDGVS